jgi:nucleoside-diphosphate-sugar epimerase
MKLLVIGGTNFIGPHVLRHLIAMGHEVTIFHRGETTTELPSNVTVILGDRSHISDFKSEFQRLAPQVVLDMIPYTEQDALTLMSTFVGIAHRVVAISSIDVYRAYDVLWGRESDVVPVPLTEDSPLRQQLYPYKNIPEKPLKHINDDYEKILVERVVMSNPDLPGTIVRLPMVYGAKDIRHRVFACLRRMNDKRPVILLEENVAQWRGSYGYVENIAYAIALAATDERAVGRIYHVADNEALTEAERITRIGQVAGWQGKVVIVPRDKLPEDWKPGGNIEQHWFIDSTRIRQELNYSEVVSLEEALKKSIEWQRNHPPQEPQKFAEPWWLDYGTEDVILDKAKTPSPYSRSVPAG